MLSLTRLQSRIVPISFGHRRIGEVTLVTCTGRIVEGAESAGLRAILDELLQDGSRLVLHADALAVIELPTDFSRQDAGDSGPRRLEQVRAAIAPS